MNRSPHMHSNFFSSLKQVEKRLKIENPSPATASDPTMTESLSSPIYLLNPENQTKLSSKLDDSELPCEFISMSSEFSTTQDDPILQPEKLKPDMLDESEDDIQLLMQLLHLPSLEEESDKSQEPRRSRCDDNFYAKVVGIKGPKCQLEMERLDSWIRHLEKGDGVKTFEPLRLAHLLLGKAASVSADEGRDKGLEFPSTIQDFLLNDPPISNSEKI